MCTLLVTMPQPATVASLTLEVHTLWEDRKHTTRHQLVYNQFMYASCKQQL
jgi:hypothetical protein